MTLAPRTSSRSKWATGRGSAASTSASWTDAPICWYSARSGTGLVVREDFQGPFRTVVVGVDFSETSRRALEAGAMLAANEAAKLWTVFVVPDAHGSALAPAQDVEQELEMFTRAVTDAWPGLEVRCDVYPHTGHRSGILEFATVVHGDIVVLGTRGRTNLRDVVLGSTAEKVLRDSLIAVWACKPGEAATDRA